MYIHAIICREKKHCQRLEDWTIFHTQEKMSDKEQPYKVYSQNAVFTNRNIPKKLAMGRKLYKHGFTWVLIGWRM